MESLTPQNLKSLKIPELYALARKYKIKRYQYLRKANLIKAIENPHQDLSSLYVGMCKHGVIKYYCTPCMGSQICQHNIQRTRCKKCKGGSICQHNRERFFCKECGGNGICCHRKHKRWCKECTAAQVQKKETL